MWNVMYKCKKCGEIFVKKSITSFNGVSSDQLVADALSNKYETKKVESIYSIAHYVMHNCGINEIGDAEYIGVEKVQVSI